MNTTVPLLLANGDGQCGAWAKLFIESLSAQGIEHTTEYIVFSPDPVAMPGANGFLVKDWSFPTTGGLSGDPNFPYLNFVPAGTDFYGATGFLWTFAEVSDLPGIPGQSNLNPNSLFGNHQVVKFGTPLVYYDPSYGNTFATLGDMDMTGLSAFIKVDFSRPVYEGAIAFDENGDGDMLDTFAVDAVLIKPNPAGNQLKETPGEWPP
jgi:hypothetical protein